MPSFNALLNPPAFPADRYAPLADRLKRLLTTTSDVIFVQAEAILALEAAALSLARPGMTAINIVTSPYGGYFGAWLRRGGASVHEIVAPPGLPIAIEAVEAAIKGVPQLDLIAVVHAETSSGILNPLAAIATLARARGALLVVDAVASIGGHPLEIDALGIDIAVIGPQKALGGPAGLAAVSVSQRAWTAMAKAPDFSPSNLSLLDIKKNWLDRGRGVPPGMPSPLEFWALEAALDRVEAEGLDALIARHQLAANASRAGLRALGTAPWIADDRSASALATAAPVPTGIDVDQVIAMTAEWGVVLTPGFGEVSNRLVRLDHAGAKANFSAVLANVFAFGSALARLGEKVDVGAAAQAITSVYAKR
jgi:aspartate aminotransferase-like enzyme